VTSNFCLSPLCTISPSTEVYAAPPASRSKRKPRGRRKKKQHTSKSQEEQQHPHEVSSLKLVKPVIEEVTATKEPIVEPISENKPPTSPNMSFRWSDVMLSPKTQAFASKDPSKKPTSVKKDKWAVRKLSPSSVEAVEDAAMGENNGEDENYEYDYLTKTWSLVSKGYSKVKGEGLGGSIDGLEVSRQA